MPRGCNKRVANDHLVTSPTYTKFRGRSWKDLIKVPVHARIRGWLPSELSFRKKYYTAQSSCVQIISPRQKCCRLSCLVEARTNFLRPKSSTTLGITGRQIHQLLKKRSVQYSRGLHKSNKRTQATRWPVFSNDTHKTPR